MYTAKVYTEYTDTSDVHILYKVMHDYNVNCRNLMESDMSSWLCLFWYGHTVMQL